MSNEKEKKPRKAPAKKPAETGNGAEKKATAKPKVAAAGTKAAPKAAAKSAVAAGVPEAAVAIVKATVRPSHQQIAELAHSYYVARGWKHGYHEQDWLRAEQVLITTR